MSKRLHDTEIWDEDWFIDLPDQYKLFYLFIKDKCDHAGVWRVNKRKFITVVPGRQLFLDDFLSAVNKPDEGETTPKERIVVLQNNRWWLPGFIGFQAGGRFDASIGAHRGFLKILVNNEIPLEKVPNFSFGFLYQLENKQLKEIVHSKSMYSAYQEYAKRYDRGIEIEREKEQEKEKGKEDSKGEKPVLKLIRLYDHGYEFAVQYFPSLTETDYMKWREFVDVIEINGFQDLYQAKFISPLDFGTIYNSAGFKEHLWIPVCKKLLSTGVLPQHNLYFRIPEFMKYITSSPGNDAKDNTSSDTDIENQEKWD